VIVMQSHERALGMAAGAPGGKSSNTRFAHASASELAAAIVDVAGFDKIASPVLAQCPAYILQLFGD
jgi:hypothetical protein